MIFATLIKGNKSTELKNEQADNCNEKSVVTMVKKTWRIANPPRQYP